MGINEEINQRQFRTSKQKALINLMYTHNFLVNHMNLRVDWFLVDLLEVLHNDCMIFCNFF